MGENLFVPAPHRISEVFQDVTFLPANVLLFQTPELSGQAGSPPPKSDQLHHFALSGQLCRETKLQSQFSMVSKFFLETHTKGYCDQLITSHQAAKPKRWGPELLTHFSIHCCWNRVDMRCTAAGEWKKPECQMQRLSHHTAL